MRKKIHSAGAPPAVGPYSQGIRAGNLIFCAGQLGLDPETKTLVEGVQAQTRRALQNLSAVLAAEGSSLKDVVKATVFLANIADFKAMNEVYAEFFEEPYPARAALAVKDLPLGGVVEIEVIAVVDEQHHP